MDIILHRLMLYMAKSPKSDTFHQLANKMIEHIDKLPSLGIEDMAELCFVSTSTLSRFCRKLGYKNFNSFKDTFDTSYGFEIDYEPNYINSNKSLNELIDIHNEENIHSLTNIHENIDINTLKNLCVLIHDNKQVSFLGHTNYEFLAMYLQTRLGLFKKIVYTHLDVYEQSTVVKNMTDDDLAIIISPRGENVIRNLIKPLYKQGVKTVLITQNPHPSFKDKFNLFINIGGTSRNNLGMMSMLYYIDLIVLTYYSLYKDELIV